MVIDDDRWSSQSMEKPDVAVFSALSSVMRGDKRDKSGSRKFETVEKETAEFNLQSLLYAYNLLHCTPCSPFGNNTSTMQFSIIAGLVAFATFSAAQLQTLSDIPDCAVSFAELGFLQDHDR